MGSVDTSPVNLVKTDNQRLSVRAEIFVTKGWQAMITYEEALKKARVCWDEVNYFGECINYVAFLDGGYNTAIVSEKYI